MCATRIVAQLVVELSWKLREVLPFNLDKERLRDLFDLEHVAARHQSEYGFGVSTILEMSEEVLTMFPHSIRSVFSN